MIRFLLKSAFWLGLAFMVMPRLLPAERKETPPAPAVHDARQGPVDQLLAHGETAVKLGRICADDPAFCKNGTALLAGAGRGLLEKTGAALGALSDLVAEKPQEKQQAAVPVPTSRAAALKQADRAPARE